MDLLQGGLESFGRSIQDRRFLRALGLGTAGEEDLAGGRVDTPTELHLLAGTALDGGRTGGIELAPAAADDQVAVPGVAQPRKVVLRRDPGIQDHPCTGRRLESGEQGLQRGPLGDGAFEDAGSPHEAAAVQNPAECPQPAIGAAFLGATEAGLGLPRRPALRLASRDRWIGWDETLRSQHLNHAVLGRSRFLIRPSVRCRNLGSRVLGMVLARLPDEIEARYGYRPLRVETFVDPETHAGTVFAAAGWERVGETTGRGRFARPGQARRLVKAVWMRPLRSDGRRILGVASTAVEALGPADGRERGSWTANEFGGAPLGDRRLSRRLVTSASLMADQPGASFPAAAQGRRAPVTGYYRMIDPPAASAVPPEALLAPHRERTRRRMASCTTVLMIQDGSDLNFATHPKCGELGLIGRNRNASGTRGLHLHSTLAVDADTGIPLGVPRIESDAPDGRAEKGKPLEERKSARWMRGLRDTSERVPDGVRVVSVLDREADFFARFAERQQLGNVDLLVRARHNRSLGKDEEKLFEQLAAEASAGSLEIEIARPSARTSTRTQKAKALREARVAKVSLQFRRFDLPPPGNGTGAHDPVPMTAARMTEEDPPDGVEPLNWILLTSLPVSTRKEARRVLELYRLRGRIEDGHRVLKSGCKAEFLNHREGHRIERAVTIKAVIAWRLFAMVMLGRETPNCLPRSGSAQRKSWCSRISPLNASFRADPTTWEPPCTPWRSSGVISTVAATPRPAPQ